MKLGLALIEESALVIREPALRFHQTVDVGRVEENPHRWLAVQSTVINSEHAAAKRRIVESGHHRIHFFRWGVLDPEAPTVGVEPVPVKATPSLAVRSAPVGPLARHRG